MRILCRHGHFSFFQAYPGEIAEFAQYWETELVRVEGFYTFPLLAEAPEYSLKGKSFLGLTAVKTFEGTPWEIMRENGFVYSLAEKSLVPKASIAAPYTPVLTGYYFSENFPMLQPGLRVGGNQILSWDASYNDSQKILKISEFGYE